MDESIFIMNAEQLSIQEKLAHVLANINLLPSLYQADAGSLKSLLAQSSIPCHSQIKIETFHRLTQPALHSLHWQQPHEQNKYPVALVIASRTELENEEVYCLGVKFVTWVESGGVRCVAAKPVLREGKEGEIEKLIGMTHCAVVGDLGLANEEEKKFIEAFLHCAEKEQYYPIMFMGSSCIYALEILEKEKVQEQKKQQSSNSELYIDYSSKLFKGIDPTLRLQFQNRKRQASPKVLVSPCPQQTNFLPSSHMLSPKTKTPLPCTLQHKNKPIFLLPCDPCQSDTPENIQLWHYPTLNFVDLAKQVKKDVDEKKVDKGLVGVCKIGFKGEQGYYRLS